MSSAQLRTSCTKRSWWTARKWSSTRQAAATRLRRRRPSSPPDGGRHPGSPSHFQSRSLTWTYTRPTATSDCRTCRGRKGCRTAAPIYTSIAVDFPPHSNDSPLSAHLAVSTVAFTRRLFTGEKDRAMMWNSRNTLQLSNFRDPRARQATLEEFKRCYFLKYYSVVCEGCAGLYVTRRFGDDRIEESYANL